MKTKYLQILAAGLLAVSLTACDDEVEKEDYNRLPSGQALPAVSQASCTSDRYEGQATVTFTVEAQEGNPVSQSGLLVSREGEPELGNPSTDIHYTQEQTGTLCTVVIDAIENGATYHVKPFAYTGNGIAYGPTLTFTGDVETYEGWQRSYDETVDFTGAPAAQFGPAELDADQTAAGWTYVPMAVAGMAQYGFFSGLWEPGALFGQGSGRLAGASCRNVLNYETDLTGRTRPQVHLALLNLEALFGESGYAANVRVYASETPVATAADLAAATLIGTTGLTSADDIADFTFSVPAAFRGRTYIVLYHEAIYTDDLSDYGIVLLGYGLSSIKAPRAEEAPALRRTPAQAFSPARLAVRTR